MKSTKMLFAAALGFVAVSAAQAKTISLGDADGVRTFGNTVEERRSFTDYVKFYLDDASSSISGFFGYSSIKHVEVELERKAGQGWEDVGSAFTTTFSFADLAKGTYRFEIEGFSSSKKRDGSWTGTMTVAAVPEADVWLMLLIGAGLIGYQLRRKQRSLQQPSFTA
jgi:hypothetical protein